MSDAVASSAAPAAAPTSTQTADTGSDTQASSDQTEGTQTPPAAQAKSMREKFKLKVDGEEFEEEIDLADKDGLTKRLQLSAAAQKRMAEAKAEKKKAWDIIQAFEADPETMLSRLGPKGREIAEKYLLKQIQDDMLSPEQKRIRDLERENEGFKSEKQKAEEARAKEAQDKKDFEIAQTFQTTIIDALNKTGLPKSPVAVKRMAALLKKNISLGLDLDASDLADEYKKERFAEHKALIGEADGDQLISLLGEDVAKKIRMSDLKKLQEKHNMVFKQGNAPQSAAPQANSEKGPMSIDEWREDLDRRFGKK